MTGSLIEQFIEKSSIEAMNTLINTNDINQVTEASIQLAKIFGETDNNFASIANPANNAEIKLINSFHNNLLLLIQKTWVEKSDEELKAQVLYQLEEFSSSINSKSYIESYNSFFTILDNVVYLMFGVQSKSKDFDEYALRIDPEFGIFWWYITELPHNSDWSQEKVRLALLLGMYFLANY